MSLEFLLCLVVVVVALGFDFTNGFHDAANAIATSISTRALTPRVALLLAAVCNFVGALLGVGVAETIGSGIVGGLTGSKGLVIVLSALLGAISWNIFTWRFGLPSSSSHALIGALMGAGLASASQVKWSVIIDRVIAPMVLSPVLGFVLAYLLMVAVMWCFRNRRPGPTQRGFRIAQTVSAAAMALGHGLQDAQKTMGVIVIALVAGGYHSGFGIPLWVKFAAAGVISLGTYLGGWRIIRTLGSKLVDLDPARGFAAEAVASSILYTAAFTFHAPISTTQSITAAVLGAGATKRLSTIRIRVVKQILTAWLLTLPAAALMAALIYGLAGLVT